tara:strand:- start:4904 stop:6496 length:1593 start_codon:yes stop_codon:yes gene_type:complete
MKVKKLKVGFFQKKRGVILSSIIFIALFSFIIIAGHQSGTVTIITPVNLTNISGTIVLNATISGVQSGTNVTNVTFFYDNGSGIFVEIGSNSSVNLTEYTFVWDTTTTNGDGANFSVNATASFVNESEAEVVNFTSVVVGNFTVDNTAPTITLNTPADGNQDNNTLITFNFSVTDNVFNTLFNCNLTLDPTNSSGGANINSTSNVPNGTTVAFTNVVPSGGHVWNVTCIDNVDTNNVGTSNERSFGSGTVGSKVTLDLLDSLRKSKTTFGATDTIIIACTRSDDDGYNITEVLMKFPKENVFSSLKKVIEPTAVNLSQTLEVDFDETKNLGEYIAKCTVTDVLGNINSTNKTFTVQKKVKAGSSAFSNKNFVPAVAKVKINKGSISSIGKLTTEGFSRLMQKSAKVTFDVKGEDHSVQVKELNEEAVTLTISSEPFDVTLNKGESKNVDVNKDGKSDIKVTFHKQFGRHADLTINLLSGEELQKEQEIKEAEKKEKAESTTSSAGSFLVTIIVILIVIVVGYFLIKGKKR